jgi:hypothetical protein
MSDADKATDENEPTQTDIRDQRIAKLEEKVRTLTEKLDQQSSGGGSSVTRRQTLGLLGGGALLGAAGTASAQPGRNGGRPGAADKHDHSGEYDTSRRLGQAATVEDRDIVTSGPIQIWVDPDGDDGAVGTENAPVASLQEALDRLPYILAHPADIVLTSGTTENPTVHDTGVGVISAMHTSVYSGYQEARDYFDNSTGMNVAIRSESGNPNDTILHGDYFLSFAFLGNSPLNVGIENLTVDAGVQNYGGVFGLNDCVLRGSPEFDILFAGYAGNTYATRCEITAPIVTTDSAGAVTGLNGCIVDSGTRTSSVGEQAVMMSTDAVMAATNNRIDAADAILQQYQSGVTVFIKGGEINVPYFGEGAIGFIVTQDNIYHPAAPNGII